MRRFLKFLHTMGAIGFMGAMAALLVLLHLSPASPAGADAALLRTAMAAIANWVVMPSFVLTLIPGLLAIAATRAYHNAGWAWIKAASGVLVFAGGLHVLAPIQSGDPAALAAGETGTIWVLLAVSTANVVLGIWRPRFLRRPAQAISRKNASTMALNAAGRSK
jgi:hypothetical protein